jgi:hypothetical protein
VNNADTDGEGAAQTVERSHSHRGFSLEIMFANKISEPFNVCSVGLQTVKTVPDMPTVPITGLKPSC